MGALFYLEDRIKAVRNVIDNSIATYSPIIEETVSSTLLEIYSEMKVEEEILNFFNNQIINTNIFLRKSQLNIDLIIPKCVSEEEKNLEPVESSRRWCQDSLNILLKGEATVQIWASTECSVVAFLIETEEDIILNTVQYINSLSNFTSSGQQPIIGQADENEGGKRQRVKQIYPRILRRTGRTLYKIRGWNSISLQLDGLRPIL